MEYPGQYADELAALLQSLTPEPEIKLSGAEMRELLDNVFYASLLHEEGRPVRVSVNVASRSSQSSREDVLFLSEALPVSPESLRTLSMAIDPISDALLVERSGEGLIIFGFIRDLVRQPLHRRLRSFEGLLHIQALSPGALSVEWGGSCVLRFSAGKVVRLRAAWNNTGTVALASCDGLNEVQDQMLLCLGVMRPTCAPPVLSESVISLGELGRSMIERGHGGTVLVAPTDGVALISPEAGYPTDSRHSSMLTEAIERYRSHSPTGEIEQKDGLVPYESVEALRKVRSAVQFAASLTQVDGALLLAPDLSILRLGAVILGDGRLDDLASLRVYNPMSGQTGLGLSGVGTRHRSAVRFCRAQPGPAMAMVASQDGVLTLILKEEQETHAIRPVLFKAI